MWGRKPRNYSVLPCPGAGACRVLSQKEPCPTPVTLWLSSAWGRSEERRTDPRPNSPAHHGGDDLNVAQSSQGPHVGHVTVLPLTFVSDGCPVEMNLYCGR